MKKGIVPAFATQIRGLSGCAHSMRSTLNPPTITFSTLLLFWVENVIVGGFNVLRMLWAQPDNPLIWVAKAGTIPFFIFHYGMFTTVHGVFVLTLFGGVNQRGFPGPSTFLHAVQAAGIWPAALALAASHGVSFAFNYIGAGE